jgi:hypothetical protein
MLGSVAAGSASQCAAERTIRALLLTSELSVGTDVACKGGPERATLARRQSGVVTLEHQAKTPGAQAKLRTRPIAAAAARARSSTWLGIAVLRQRGGNAAQSSEK